MNNVNLFLRGNLWQSHGDEGPGWEWICRLQSSDPQVRKAAADYLLEAGPRSIQLLQAGVVSGTMGAAFAAECLVVLLNKMSIDTSEDAAFIDFEYDC